VKIELTKSEKSNGLRWPPWGIPEVASNVFEKDVAPAIVHPLT